MIHESQENHTTLCKPPYLLLDTVGGSITVNCYIENYINLFSNLLNNYCYCYTVIYYYTVKPFPSSLVMLDL